MIQNDKAKIKNEFKKENKFAFLYVILIFKF